MTRLYNSVVPVNPLLTHVISAATKANSNVLIIIDFFSFIFNTKINIIIYFNSNINLVLLYEAEMITKRLS